MEGEGGQEDAEVGYAGRSVDFSRPSVSRGVPLTGRGQRSRPPLCPDSSGAGEPLRLSRAPCLPRHH